MEWRTALGLFPCHLLLLSILALSQCSPGEVQTSENRTGPAELTLIFSGELEGMISPCDCKEGHLGGLARRQTFLKGQRIQDPDLILVETGDTFVNFITPNGQKEDLFILDTLAKFNYLALTPGESEFQIGPELLEKKAEELGLPYVCANIFPDENLTQPVFKRNYVMKETPRIKVGVSGVFNPDLNKTRVGRRVADLYFKDPVETCRRTVSAMEKEGCGLIIMLAHVGQAMARQIAEEVPGIDILVVGHGRYIFPDPIKVNHTYLLQVEDRGRKIGKARLTVNEKGEITGIHQEIFKLDESYAEDEEIKSLIERFYDTLREGEKNSHQISQSR